MHPVLFHLPGYMGDIGIGTYGVLFVAGLGLAILVTRRVASWRGENPSAVLNNMILVEVGGVVGAVTAGLVVYSPLHIVQQDQGSLTLVSWGGIAGGCAVLVLLKILWKENVALLADMAAPGMMAGMALGRTGCFFGGCCYGVNTGSCWGVRFTDPIAPASSALQPLVPVQLVSAALLLAGAGATLFFALKYSGSGAVFATAMLGYACGRFLIEFWRDDPRMYCAGLTDGQVFSLVAGPISLAYLLLVVLRKRAYSD